MHDNSDHSMISIYDQILYLEMPYWKMVHNRHFSTVNINLLNVVDTVTQQKEMSPVG